jgi:hypothetical protein
MLKIKHERECDCVVAGFRWHKKGERTMVGSLLLGLYNDGGALQHVGVCASFTEAKRRELVELLKPYRKNALANHPWKSWAEQGAADGDDGQRMPGAQSRWSSGKDLSWEPLRPELIVEVAYDHMQGDRFRHTAQFRRWRPDKKPRDCTYEQLEVVAPKSWRRSSPAGAEETFASAGAAWPRGHGAIRASDRRRARASPAAAAALRHIPQIHPDARPGRRPPAHRVDQHVVGREQRGGFRVFVLPPFQTGARRFRSGEFAITRSGAFVRGFRAAARAREGATRGASPSIFRKCGGQGASPRPPPRLPPRAQQPFERSGRVVHARVRIAELAKRLGTVNTVKSAGSHSATSCQWSGVETRASGSGRTE